MSRKEKYLTKPAQFALVYEKGNSWAGGLLVVKVLPNRLPITRFGFSVGQRVGKAVVRNRVKRQLREISRAVTVRQGWDIVVIARWRAAGADYSKLRKEAEELLARAQLLNKTKIDEKVCVNVD